MIASGGGVRLCFGDCSLPYHLPEGASSWYCASESASSIDDIIGRNRIETTIASGDGRDRDFFDSFAPGLLPAHFSMDAYRILCEVGRGSYARALKAFDRLTLKEVVIKVIDVQSMSSKQRSDAMNEIAVLKQLRHPFIIRHIDSFSNGFDLCLVLEFADGGDMAARIQGKRREHDYFSEAQILRWFTQILLGLAFIHSKNIMHRDIKPQNIFLTRNGESALIGDFGVCRVMESKQHLAETIIGTPYYMAPELYQHRPYSIKSDIWALGCLLYEMSALTVPFEAKDVHSLSVRVCRGSNPAFPARYSNSLRSLFNSMLQRDYHARPTADQLLASPLVSAAAQALSREGRQGLPTGPTALSTNQLSSSPIGKNRGSTVTRSTSPNKVPSRERCTPSPSVRSISPRRDIDQPKAVTPRSFTRPAFQSPRSGQPTRQRSSSPYKSNLVPTSTRNHSPAAPLVSSRGVRNAGSSRVAGDSPRNLQMRSPSPLRDLNAQASPRFDPKRSVKIYPASPLRQRINS